MCKKSNPFNLNQNIKVKNIYIEKYSRSASQVFGTRLVNCMRHSTKDSFFLKIYFQDSIEIPCFHLVINKDLNMSKIDGKEYKKLTN